MPGHLKIEKRENGRWKEAEMVTGRTHSLGHPSHSHRHIGETPFGSSATTAVKGQEKHETKNGLEKSDTAEN